MAIDIPRPNITATTEAGRLEQVRSYLYQMAEQLNYALNTVETKMETVVLETSRQVSSDPTPEETLKNFSSIKALIIKSADIVDEYYEKINKRLEGMYVASGVFGEFREDTSATLEANSKNIGVAFENIQQITSAVENIQNQYRDTTAYIRAGELYDSTYGIEVGQTTTENGEVIFKKFARFSSDKLAFYNAYGQEMGYISDSTLYITHARFGGDIYHGGYRIDSSDGIAYIWEEGE